MQSLEFEKKILLLGDGAVGKTSLVRRFVIDKFADQYIATIGTKTSRKTMQFVFEPEQTTVNLHLDIWDILGQSGMERAHTVYFKGAESVIYVCDGTRKATFGSIPTWIGEVEKNCGSRLPGVLACNKADLRGEFQVDDDELKSLAAEQKLSLFWTSAKTGDNVEQAFREVGGFLCGPILAKYAGGKGPKAAVDEKKKGRFRR